jgi:hypothetical protein
MQARAGLVGQKSGKKMASFVKSKDDIFFALFCLTNPAHMGAYRRQWAE